MHPLEQIIPGYIVNNRIQEIQFISTFSLVILIWCKIVNFHFSIIQFAIESHHNSV